MNKKKNCDGCSGEIDVYSRICLSQSLPINPKIQRSLRSSDFKLNLDEVPSRHIQGLAVSLRSIKNMSSFSISGDSHPHTRTSAKLGKIPKSNSKNPTITKELLKGFAEQPKSSLCSLSLVGLRLSFTAWNSLNQGLQSAKSLKSLTVSYCNLSDKSLSLIFPGLIGCSQLESLDFSHNSITKGYEIGRVLTKLNVKSDEMQWIQGLRGESQVVKNDGLCKIDLSFNKISNRGLNDICTALYHDSHLKYLDLGHNLITEDGFPVIETLMATNKSLLYVNLGPSFNHDIICNRLKANLRRSSIESSAIKFYKNKLNGIKVSDELSPANSPRKNKLPKKRSCSKCQILVNKCRTLSTENEKLKSELHSLKNTCLSIDIK